MVGVTGFEPATPTSRRFRCRSSCCTAPAIGIDSLRRLYGASTDQSWMVLAPFPSIPKIQGIANFETITADA
jgi:hypothetical protein